MGGGAAQADETVNWREGFLGIEAGVSAEKAGGIQKLISNALFSVALSDEVIEIIWPPFGRPQRS